jgi:hypothetical protein
LDILTSIVGCPPSNGMKLQKTTLLENPTKLVVHVHPLQGGASFILCQQYVYVLDGSPFLMDSLLVRYHWLSMQRHYEIHFPRIDGMMAWLAETQLNPSERFISAVKVGAPKITVTVRSVSEEALIHCHGRKIMALQATL